MANVLGVDHKVIAAVTLGVTSGVAILSTLQLWRVTRKKKKESVYESQRALHEYLLFHYGGPGEVLRFDFGPKNSLDFPKRCADMCMKYFELKVCDVNHLPGGYCGYGVMLPSWVPGSHVGGVWIPSMVCTPDLWNPHPLHSCIRLWGFAISGLFRLSVHDRILALLKTVSPGTQIWFEYLTMGPGGGYSLYDGWYICAAVLTPFFWPSGYQTLSFWGVFFSSTNTKTIFWVQILTKFDLFGPKIPFSPRSFWVQFSVAHGTPPAIFGPSTPPPPPPPPGQWGTDIKWYPSPKSMIYG